jgi:hypothetical protein
LHPFKYRPEIFGVKPFCHCCLKAAVIAKPIPVKNKKYCHSLFSKIYYLKRLRNDSLIKAKIPFRTTDKRFCAKIIITKTGY